MSGKIFRRLLKESFLKYILEILNYLVELDKTLIKLVL